MLTANNDQPTRVKMETVGFLLLSLVTSTDPASRTKYY